LTPHQNYIAYTDQSSDDVDLVSVLHNDFYLIDSSMTIIVNINRVLVVLFQIRWEVNVTIHNQSVVIIHAGMKGVEAEFKRVGTSVERGEVVILEVEAGAKFDVLTFMR